MARKKKHEEHENHERWLVSYADFITLLFAFFVVMYSVSSVNEGKYRVLSDAMVAAFRAPPKSITPIQVGDPARAPAQADYSERKSPVVIIPFKRPLPTPRGKETQPGKAPQEQQASQNEAAASIKAMADDIERAMQGLIEQDLVKVRRDKFWLEVEISSSILYSSGSARLESDSLPVMEMLAKVLAPFPNVVHVEGFTDNVPISTLAFPSNWELSAARAASVVTLFARAGVDPVRMAAIGYGEFRPVGENDTEEGRAKNRRVVVVVLSQGDQHDTATGTDPVQLEQKLNPLPVVPEPVVPAGPIEPPQAILPAEPDAPAATLAPSEPAAASALTTAVEPTAQEPGEPVDVTSRPVTEVGRFPIIDLPIAVPLPATAQPAAN